MILKYFISSFSSSLIVIVFSFAGAQSLYEKKFVTSKNLQTEIGSFLNYGSDGFELDGYFNFRLKNGLFGDIWIDQIDLDTTSTFQSYTSLGMMKDLGENRALGFGYANSRMQSTQSGGIGSYKAGLNANVYFHEFLLGGTLNDLTTIIYMDFSNFMNLSFSSTLNFDLSSYFEINEFDISLDGFFYNQGVDLYLRASKSLKSRLTVGTVISRERYESVETKTINKNGTEYQYDETSQASGFFNLFYIGFVFN